MEDKTQTAERLPVATGTSVVSKAKVTFVGERSGRVVRSLDAGTKMRTAPHLILLLLRNHSCGKDLFNVFLGC